MVRKYRTVLKNHFKPLGIEAFTNCCRSGCTGSYGEDEDFVFRKKGIFFFRLHMTGMNYREYANSVAVNYDDFEYVMKHWDEEEKIIHDWCSLLNIPRSQYSIEKPKDETTAIIIEFNPPIKVF